MIALDKKNQIAYVRAGKTEVWIWWYSSAKHFAVTTRVGGVGGKVTPRWLAGEVSADSISKPADPIAFKDGIWTAPGDNSIPNLADGATYMVESLEHPGSILIAHRQGNFQFDGRLDDDPSPAFSYRLVDWPKRTVKQSLIGWAY